MTPTPKRRWSFSLRVLFLVVTVVGIWLGWNLKQVRDRERMLALIVERDATVIGLGSYEKPLPLIWWLFGAKSIGRGIIIWMPESQFTDDEVERAKYLFPEASVDRRLPLRHDDAKPDR
jgi:hypothetical protein